jgi:REP element-mobilizing transposase RayT
MPRPHRVEVPNGIFHVTTRGCDKRAIYDGDATRELQLALLAQTVEEYDWLCHAYCQMDNHFHLLVQTPHANLSDGMRFLNGAYAQAFNRETHRSGHLFQGRFHSVRIVWDGQLWEAARYVVLNRVRARSCRSVEEWRWSSYAATAGLAPKPTFLTTELLLSRFRAPDRYRRFIAEGSSHASLRGLLAVCDRSGTRRGSDPGQTPAVRGAATASRPR